MEQLHLVVSIYNQCSWDTGPKEHRMMNLWERIMRGKNLSEMDGIRNRMAGKYQMLDKFSEAVWHQVSHRRKAEDFLAPFTQTQGLRFGSWRGFGEM